MILQGGESELFYELRGNGPDVVLLHPYPCDHTFWLPIVPYLETRFRLILPDLRGLGQSPVAGEATTMAQLAQDALRLCDSLGVARAAFVGCSVGGYTLFELWRQARERVKALAFLDTRAGLDGEAGIQDACGAAEDVLQRGPAWAIEQMMPRMVSPYTLQSRPDIVDVAKATMRRATAPGMAAMQRGMAQRADSVDLLPTIGVPSLVLGGKHDAPAPVAEMERIASGIPAAELKIIARAGHMAALERPEEAGPILRDFLERFAR